jgi:hypothetical protein
MIARLLFLVCLVAGVIAAQSAPPRKDIPAIAKAANGVIVSIITSDKNGKPVAQGTGFLVSKDGRIVTNYHVIKGASSAVVKLPDGAFYDVDGVVAFDKARDLAVIKAHGQNFRVVSLGDSDRVQVGEEIVAIGSPLSLESTVSSGIVSGIRTIKEEGGKFLQITAPISPGSSGGPLFNMAGEVVGITTLYLKGGENLNFAIPSNDARLLLSAGSKVQDFPVETSDPLAALGGIPATPNPAPSVDAHKDVPQILNWIQTHFEVPTDESTVQLIGGSAHTTRTVTNAISFKDCQVTVTESITVTTPGAPSLGVAPDSQGTITTRGPLDLGSLNPNLMLVEAHGIGHYWLEIASTKTFPEQWTGTHNGKNLADAFPIDFVTREIAERQQKAWHDAILLCGGGKPTQDDLY